MNYDNLPTDDLKEFGIIGADNTFSKKLSNDDIQKCIPCCVEDYENAKKGILARRLK